MAITTWESSDGSVPAFGYYTNTITAGSSPIVSIGWQNDGNATNLYASQAFVYDNGQKAYIQVINTSASDTTVNVWVVLDSDSSASNTAAAHASPTQQITSEKLPSK